MTPEFDHVGIALEDIDDALGFYADTLGLEVTHEEEFNDMRIVFLGDEFELLEPLDGGAVARFIESNGEGIQHVAVRVDDIEGELGRLAYEGVNLIDEEPREGAKGKRIAFVHPSDTHGVLLELCEY